MIIGGRVRQVED